MSIDWTKGSTLAQPLPITVKEAMERQKAPYRKYPKLMYWKDLKADRRGFNWVQNETKQRIWPDQTEEWDEVEELIDAGRASTELEALDLLYKENESFRDEMDALWEGELEYCAEQDRKRRMAVWHRAAWSAVWARRLRGPAVPVRWSDECDRECTCPKCAGTAALQCPDSRGKRKAQCEECAYRFKLVRVVLAQ